MTDLDAIIDEYLDEYWHLHPVSASAAGVGGHDGDLGDFSSQSFENRARRDDAWLERMGELADADLTDDEAIDRDLIVSAHRGNQLLHDWEGWRRNADLYAGAGLNGVFSLFLRRFGAEPELAAAALSRMEQIPGVLDHGKTNLEPSLTEPALLRRSVGQCRAGAAYFRDVVPTEVDDAGLRAQLSEAGEVVTSAYEDFGAFLDELADRASGSYAIGEPRYSALLQEREALEFDAAALRDRGQAVYDDLDAEMRELARQIDPSSDGDWATVLGRLKGDHADDAEGMRAEYAALCDEARSFLVEHDLVTLPDGEECEVVPSPPFQRPMLAVASYIQPPAFGTSLKGRFNVPFPADDATDEQVRDRLRDNSRVLAPSITVHEAYPGHHWHFAVLSHAARPIRRVLTTPYFVEGWGLYAEKMMDEQGFFTDPGARLGYLQARIFRAARIVVDTSLHLGEMDREEATTTMMRRSAMEESVARAEVLRYTAWPTQAASYLTGSLVIEELRDEYLGADDGHSLKGFHDRIAASGGMPLGLARRALGL